MHQTLDMRWLLNLVTKCSWVQIDLNTQGKCFVGGRAHMRRDHVGDHIHSHFHSFISGNRLRAVSLFLENRVEERKTSKGHACTLTCFEFFPTNFRGKETMHVVCFGNGVNYYMVTVRLLKPGSPRQWKPNTWQNWNNRFQQFQIQVINCQVQNNEISTYLLWCSRLRCLAK